MPSFPTEIGGLPLGFLQIGKIIDEFSPIFPVAQLVKRQQCLVVAISYNGRSGYGSVPGLQTKTINNYHVREFVNAQRRLLQWDLSFALYE
jgi:hypothetical protein